MQRNRLIELQSWYLAQCDGDWEHQQGVRIDTVDNPGWSLSIDLHGTLLEGVTFAEVNIQRSEHDWLMCRRDALEFRGSCGPSNLEELLGVFLDWASVGTRRP